MSSAFSRKRMLKSKLRRLEPAPFPGAEQFKNSFRFGPPRPTKASTLKRGQGLDLDKEHRAVNKKSTYEEICRRAEVTAMRRLEKIAKNEPDSAKAMKAAALIVAMTRGQATQESQASSESVPGGKKSGSGMSDELRKAIAAATRDDRAEPAPAAPAPAPAPAPTPSGMAAQ